MSAQFGSWNLDGRPVDARHLEQVKSVIARYGPDGAGSYSETDICILYQAFHTTQESRCEIQPHVCASGAVITWDGRLDNRAELIGELQGTLHGRSSDVEIIATAYEQWGTNCLRKLLGDWALAIWDPNRRSLTLAKDFVGTRHLYYRAKEGQITWSTILDPMILGEQGLSLSEEYIAGWFSSFPEPHLTPYVGIHAVPPSSFVLLCAEKETVTKYWEFEASSRIRYACDAEYEEHFRTVFTEAVRRRIRFDRSVLAELSGGMDSSAIVCVADTIIASSSSTATPCLDTVSYCNDSEPNWDERPYFTRVEERRGRPGCHIDVSGQELFKCETDVLSVTPSSARDSTASSRRFEACLASQGYRVLLSGIGGDEVTGGVPTPMPELEDLIANAQFRRLAHRLKVWALSKRKPWFHLFFEAMRGFFPPALVGVSKHKQPVPWLDRDFIQRNRAALQGYQRRLTLFGPTPSFQDNIATLDALRRQVACYGLPCEPVYEKRYPYLDRSLMEFMYAIPREQLVRPGQRRSLMRRALVGVVPDELLNRRRKAFVSRGPRVAISSEWPRLVEMTQHMISSSLGIVDPCKFSVALQQARQGEEVSVVTLMRTVAIERWLRNLNSRGIANTSRTLPSRRRWTANFSE
jgi:asparagine synthase (glutamine-hydrolysing)